MFKAHEPVLSSQLSFPRWMDGHLIGIRLYSSHPAPTVHFVDIVSVPLTGANDFPYCVKKTTHHNVVLRGGLEAGNYMPWEPAAVIHMTVDKCTEHCCLNQDTDVVFLLNR